MNNEIKSILKEEAVAKFEILSQKFPAGSMESYDNAGRF
jgi:hypothetical protein